jgi:glycosyltransferase involved in cell wall biosynthesis
MEDITNQTIFSECELILINANSPGTEEIVIQPYLKRFSNIKYIKLDQDPGLYAVWNMGIRMASGEYLTNANIDDRSRKDAYETHLKALESHPEIDLVYCGFYVSNTANQTFDKENIYTPLNLKSANPDEFSIPNMRICLPGPRPVWRKAMHEKYGFFDETFTVVSDWAFWIRAASRGSKFLKIPGLYTVFYLNPDGTSTPKNAHRQALGKLEGDYIKLRYGHLWEINENQ